MSVINRPSKNTKTSVLVVPKSAKAVVQINNAKQNKNKKKQQRQNSPSSREPWLAGIGGDYLRTLNDPFTYGPIRLGYDTMVPTELASLYYRGVIQANSTDGSLCIVALPFVAVISGSPVMYNSSGVVSTTWLTADFVNRATVQNMISKFRVVSVGLRALPLVASTAVPGLAYSGSIPSSSWNQVAATTPTFFSNLPETQWADGRLGVSVVGRPVDNDSFTFIAGSQSTGVYSNFSVPYVSFLGLPLGASVAFEVVLNVEGIRDLSDQNLGSLRGEDAGNETTGPTLCDVFPTKEGAWRKVKSYLDNPSSFTSDVSKASKLTGELLSAGASIGSVFGLSSMNRRRKRLLH